MNEGMEHDWCGRLVPIGNPQIPVTHWVIKLPDGQELVSRGCREFLQTVNCQIEATLERTYRDELINGVKFTIRLEDICPEDLDKN